MSIFSLSFTPIQRSQGSSVAQRAAYASAQRVVNVRTGEIYDFTRKKGVEETAIYMSGIKHDFDVEFWNKVELQHKRGDAVLGYGMRVALPHELSAPLRKELAQKFAFHISKKFGVACQVSLHAPDEKGDMRNFHAHYIISSCACTNDGQLGKKVTDLDGKACKIAGKETPVEYLRRAWEYGCNVYLKSIGSSERVSHKSHEKLGLKNLPTIHMGENVTAMEREGFATDVGNINRDICEYNQLVAADEALIEEGLRLTNEYELLRQELEAEENRENMPRNSEAERQELLQRVLKMQAEGKGEIVDKINEYDELRRRIQQEKNTPGADETLDEFRERLRQERGDQPKQHSEEMELGGSGARRPRMKM